MRGENDVADQPRLPVMPTAPNERPWNEFRSAMISLERRQVVANSSADSIASVPELTKNAFVS